MCADIATCGHSYIFSTVDLELRFWLLVALGVDAIVSCDSEGCEGVAVACRFASLPRNTGRRTAGVCVIPFPPNSSSSNAASIISMLERGVALGMERGRLCDGSTARGDGVGAWNVGTTGTTASIKAMQTIEQGTHSFNRNNVAHLVFGVVHVESRDCTVHPVTPTAALFPLHTQITPHFIHN